MIFKEVDIRHPLYVAKLDNGVLLCVYDGYAEDSEGRMYYCAERRINEDEYEFLGWKCDDARLGQKTGDSSVADKK